MLEAHEVPDGISFWKPKTIRDISAGHNGAKVVSQRFKDLLEELDPGQHQFFPMDLTYRCEPMREEQSYLLNVHVHQASIIDEKSNVEPNAFVNRGSDIMHLGRPFQVTMRAAPLSDLNL